LRPDDCYRAGKSGEIARFGIGIVFGPDLLPYLGQNFALKRTKD
jgi:hypothetical protein